MVRLVSLVEELEQREAAARERVSELRAQMAELTEQLEAAEERLVQLEGARVTVREVMDEVADDERAAQVREDETGGAYEVEGGSPIGVLTVPPWRPGVEVSVLPEVYQGILETLADEGPMRSKALCRALGLGEGASKVESMRVRLKRLARRGWLTEHSPGLFVLVQHTGGPGEDSGG
ncbi:hypothetical protein AB0H73_39640 [Streptomyces olivoreticuli]|uniref:hypothetical protein n=1 Tax=Streptomyces longwoodensis TaxID=68231 RepID=UPI0033C81A5E